MAWLTIATLPELVLVYWTHLKVPPWTSSVSAVLANQYLLSIPECQSLLHIYIR